MSDGMILSSDSHVFEPPDLWTNRIDAAFRDRAPHIERINGADQLVVEGSQVLAGIGLISNAGARFEAPETISDHATFDDVHSGGYDPAQHLSDMVLDGVSGEVLYPSQGLFYYKVEDGLLFSAICRAYNDWLDDFCSTDRLRLKGIAMLNVDDVSDAVGELTRCAHKGFCGAMITEYPIEERRYDHVDYEPLWAAAADLNMSISLHTATRRLHALGGIAERTVRDATRRATKVILPAMSLCDMIFSGVFERHPNFKLAIVEYELAWVPHLLATMDYGYRERHEEATYRFKNDLKPSDFFASNIYLSFQEDDIGIRLRDRIGIERMMWGSDYPHSESTFPRSREILDDILSDVSSSERQQILCNTTAELYGFDVQAIGAS
ncbi:MAG: putative TIM-barrel fold metal-dependent hydrolase [Gammaproteobacteria bacterium]|jgi:predicted TIM-barrel fold metal-dependent hydrolase